MEGRLEEGERRKIGRGERRGKGDCQGQASTKYFMFGEMEGKGGRGWGGRGEGWEVRKELRTRGADEGGVA